MKSSSIILELLNYLISESKPPAEKKVLKKFIWRCKVSSRLMSLCAKVKKQGFFYKLCYNLMVKHKFPLAHYDEQLKVLHAPNSQRLSQESVVERKYCF